jgi:hypothetical protein
VKGELRQRGAALAVLTGVIVLLAVFWPCIGVTVCGTCPIGQICSPLCGVYFGSLTFHFFGFGAFINGSYQFKT